jgi:hypothetical protein
MCFFYKTITNLCEPAVQVKRKDFLPQIWNREKFESKLDDMRDVYRKWQTSENKVRMFCYKNKQKICFCQFRRVY